LRRNGAPQASDCDMSRKKGDGKRLRRLSGLKNVHDPFKLAS